MTCWSCRDTGQVVIGAFGDVEPWSDWVESVAAHCRGHGLPEDPSSMLHPQPCPACTRAVGDAGSSPGAGEGQAGPAPVAACDDEEEGPFRLGG